MSRTLGGVTDGPPVWLLDVDGVVNARRPRWGPRTRRDTGHAAGLDWPMRWAPALVARIGALHRAGALEVRWSSTWCAWPDELERLFGLPGVVCAFTGVSDTSAAKLAAVREMLVTGRRVVWTDDDEVPEPGPLHDELTAGGRALLIRPDPRHGLTRRHLASITAFAKVVG